MITCLFQTRVPYFWFQVINTFFNQIRTEIIVVYHDISLSSLTQLVIATVLFLNHFVIATVRQLIQMERQYQTEHALVIQKRDITLSMNQQPDVTAIPQVRIALVTSDSKVIKITIFQITWRFILHRPFEICRYMNFKNDYIYCSTIKRKPDI